MRLARPAGGSPDVADDLDTAFRHLDLYDRFGCPAGHIQATFRCLVRQGPIDSKQPDALTGRVHTCWVNPNLEATPAAPVGAPRGDDQPLVCTDVQTTRLRLTQEQFRCSCSCRLGFAVTAHYLIAIPLAKLPLETVLGDLGGWARAPVLARVVVTSMRIVVAVIALVTCVHAGLWSLLQRQYSSPDFHGQLASVSYSPYTRSQHPDNGDRPTAEQIRTDLRLLSSYTRTIRTYSSTGGVELVPGIADEFGLKVTIGIWLDKNEARNEREIQSAIALARRYSNVNAIVVGNESIAARPTKTVDELISIIQRVKRVSPVPVTTGETWDIWIGKDNDPAKAEKKLEDAPKLASDVDFIAAHILPYWDGRRSTGGRSHHQIYDKLRARYQGKRIVIAEFGWPSAGYNINRAIPGRIEQALVIRDFLGARRGLRHRLQHHRSDRSALEDQRRRRRRLLGNVRRGA